MLIIINHQYSTGTDLSVTNAPIMTARVRGTDITWLDLSLDYLHWTSAELVGEDKVKNRDCHIILVAPPAPLPGCSAMKIWLDKKMNAILKAQQLNMQGEAVREMRVRKVKKMNLRKGDKSSQQWVLKELEAESFGSGHITRLTVKSVWEAQ